MSLNIDDKGNIFIYQGDSGQVVVSGIPTDKNYDVFFMVKDLYNRQIGESLKVVSNFCSNVRFMITSEFSNFLKIPEGEQAGFYTYGLKTKDDAGVENTLFVKGCCYGDLNHIIVFPKKVEV